jgi:predicted FMN-binding regulatory protein PaiB
MMHDRVLGASLVVGEDDASCAAHVPFPIHEMYSRPRVDVHVAKANRTIFCAVAGLVVGTLRGRET